MSKSDNTTERQLALDFLAPHEVPSPGTSSRSGANVLCFTSHIRTKQEITESNAILTRLLGEAKRLTW